MSAQKFLYFALLASCLEVSASSSTPVPSATIASPQAIETEFQNHLRTFSISKSDGLTFIDAPLYNKLCGGALCPRPGEAVIRPKSKPSEPTFIVAHYDARLTYRHVSDMGRVISEISKMEPPEQFEALKELQRQDEIAFKNEIAKEQESIKRTFYMGGVSSNWFVSQLGLIFRFNPDASGLKTFANGPSYFDGYKSLNEFSESYEIAFPGFNEKGSYSREWGPTFRFYGDDTKYFLFPQVEINSALRLTKFLRTVHKIPMRLFIGHADIASASIVGGKTVTCKTDPGPDFWRHMIHEGRDVFFYPTFKLPLPEDWRGWSDKNFWDLLGIWGYDAQNALRYEPHEYRRNILRAFRQHYITPVWGLPTPVVESTATVPAAKSLPTEGISHSLRLDEKLKGYSIFRNVTDQEMSEVDKLMILHLCIEYYNHNDPITGIESEFRNNFETFLKTLPTEKGSWVMKMINTGTIAVSEF